MVADRGDILRAGEIYPVHLVAVRGIDDADRAGVNDVVDTTGLRAEAVHVAPVSDGVRRGEHLGTLERRDRCANVSAEGVLVEVAGDNDRPVLCPLEDRVEFGTVLSPLGARRVRRNAKPDDLEVAAVNAQVKQAGLGGAVHRRGLQITGRDRDPRRCQHSVVPIR